VRQNAPFFVVMFFCFLLIFGRIEKGVLFCR